jgi:hypothetical protein
MRWSVLAIGLGGCNRYELFRLAGYQQETFSNRADILFVLDNSSSMVDEASALALNFDAFVGNIEQEEADRPQEDLGDAVDDYISIISQDVGYVDYQLAVTTTDVDGTWGELYGKPRPNVMRRGDPNVADKFIETLLCEATCFSDASSIPNDNSYSCGDPLVEVSRQYLDCTCGAGAYLNHCGSSQEEPLEAVFMALCRSVENPPLECFAAIDIEDDHYEPLFSDADVQSNAGLIRAESTFIPIIVTDEGDDSRRLATQDAVPETYIDLFERFGLRQSWVVIGPDLTVGDYEPVCPGPTQWGSVRYDVMTYATSGVRLDITTGPDCQPADFAAVLDELGKLLSNLATKFPLQAVPITDTLRVTINGRFVREAEIVATNEFGLDQWTDGWSYEADDNSIVFHGTAVPAYGDDVQIYYLPLDGIPRELPI